MYRYCTSTHLPMGQFCAERNAYGNIRIYEWVYSASVQGFTWREVALRQVDRNGNVT
jgi:hypothetical protein